MPNEADIILVVTERKRLRGDRVVMETFILQSPVWQAHYSRSVRTVQPSIISLFASPPKALESTLAQTRNLNIPFTLDSRCGRLLGSAISLSVDGIRIARVNADASLPYIEVVEHVDFRHWSAKVLRPSACLTLRLGFPENLESLALRGRSHRIR